jgi:predicted RNase H-like nuclease (RuvC/YqgF family)
MSLVLGALRWLSGALKGVFAGAYLQDKIKRLETQVSQLTTERDDFKERFHQERMMVQKLNERLQKLETPPDQLNENEVKILQALSSRVLQADAMAQSLSMNRTRVVHHLDRLQMGNYVGTESAMGLVFYSLSVRGREYSVKNELLP